MRIVVALGGNALQRRGEPMTVEGQRANVAVACKSLAPVAEEHELVISHGNGPQVGLLALQAAAYDEASAYPFDVLGAQTEGMIGYLIEQELGNLLPAEKPLATVLTMTLVDADDPAFAEPTKFVGPVYTEDVAQGLAARRGWVVRQDGDAWRRVVPSPMPQRIVEIRPGRVAAGAGLRRDLRRRRRDPHDVPRGHPHPVGRGGGHRQGPGQRRPRRGPARRPAGHRHRRRRGLPGLGHAAAARGRRAHPDALDPGSSRPGPWAPRSRRPRSSPARPASPAVIGSLDQLSGILAGDGGTRISVQAEGMETR